MIYTITEGQSFDPEILRQELVATVGETGWYINTSGNQVEFVGEGFDPEAIILAHFDNGAAREQVELKARIKEIRATALEWFTKNSGIATVYDLNYEAALLGASNTTTVLRNNKTPAQHLTDFGQYLGMTGEQFGAYVLDENKGPTGASAGVKMSEIEAEYLRVSYALPSLSEADVAAYQAFCDARAL